MQEDLIDHPVVLPPITNRVSCSVLFFSYSSLNGSDVGDMISHARELGKLIRQLNSVISGFIKRFGSVLSSSTHPVSQ